MMETALPDEGVESGETGGNERKGAARTCVLTPRRVTRLMVNFILIRYLRNTRILQEIDVDE
jgi:hypothetical protein